MKRQLLFVMTILSATLLFAAQGSQSTKATLVPTEQLLASYLENDADLKNLALELKKSELNRESTQIDKGFTIKLSTGDMTIKFADDTSVSVKPGVNATIPALNNLGIDVSSELGVENGKTSFNGASAKISVDIISDKAANREISLLKSDRTVLEAERNLSTKAIEKEKSFYQSLSKLLSSISSIVQKKNALIDDQNSFEKTKLEGYSASSSTYIKAEMKVLSSERELESAIHTLINDYKLFYMNCGYEIEIDDNTDLISLIPDDIPVVEAVDITQYKAENYTQVESNLWNQSVNQMSRDASTKLTLSANTGYSYRNSNGTASNTVSAGVSGAYQGLSLSASVNVPIASGSSSNTTGPGAAATSNSSSPSLTLGLSYTPQTAKKNKIQDELTQIAIEQENAKVDSAYSAYENAVKEKLLKLEDIKWNEETNNRNYEMYASVEKNMKDYYNRGLISEKDYTSAQINTLQAYVKQLTNRIDLIVYNDEVKAMFVE